MKCNPLIANGIIYASLGYAVMRVNPLFLLANPKVSLALEGRKTEMTELRNFVSRRTFPWVAVTLRAPNEGLTSAIVLQIMAFGKAIELIPPVRLANKSGWKLRLPKSQSSPCIRLEASHSVEKGKVALCKTVQGNQFICAEQSDVEGLAVDVEDARTNLRMYLEERLPKNRVNVFRSSSEVWVLGNSPSVSLSDLDKIASSAAPTIALNRFHKSYADHALREDIIVSADNLVIDQFGKEILQKSSGIPIFLASRRDRSVHESYVSPIQLNEASRESPFLISQQKLSVFGSSLIAAIQIALLLGFKRINLYGVDLDHKSFTTSLTNPAVTNRQHFISDYRSGKTWNQPHWDRIMPGLVSSALAAKVFHAEITNYTPGHRLGLFPEGKL